MSIGDLGVVLVPFPDRSGPRHLAHAHQGVHAGTQAIEGGARPYRHGEHQPFDTLTAQHGHGERGRGAEDAGRDAGGG